LRAALPEADGSSAIDQSPRRHVLGGRNAFAPQSGRQAINRGPKETTSQMFAKVFAAQREAIEENMPFQHIFMRCLQV
jgi:hypothetical protein